MALDLAAVLAHPALARSAPELVAGDPRDREVRWVHSSDIYEIAPLLRGGELLLTTGLGLATSTAEERRAYVRALAGRRIAGVALELTRTFADVPEEMVAEARLVGLPLVALRRVHPFVDVTEGINSAILESSVERLRNSDEVGRALSRVLAQRAGLDALVSTLHSLVGRTVVVTDATGDVIASAGADVATSSEAPAETAAITADGLLLGGLVVGAGDSPRPLVEAAVDRAPEFLAIELLRTGRQSLLAGRVRRDLLEGLADGGAGASAALAEHVATARVRPDSSWVGLATRQPDARSGLELVQALARRVGAQVLAADLDGTTHALLACPAPVPVDELGSRIRAALDPSVPVVAVGPGTRLEAAGRSLRAARQALALAHTGRGPASQVVQAAELVVPRLLAAVPGPLLLDDLVDEQLGDLLRAPRSETLVRTLECYLATGCSKAGTARALHLRRQSVHQRLDRITALLGCDLADPDAQTALRLALAARRHGRLHLEVAGSHPASVDRDEVLGAGGDHHDEVVERLERDGVPGARR